MTSSETVPAIEQAAAESLALDLVTLIEPELEPVPDFDQIDLKIGRGDTLDKLFRQHNLNLGHLAAIAKLEEPKKLFRRLKPGDEFQILHEGLTILRARFGRLPIIGSQC